MRFVRALRGTLGVLAIVFFPAAVAAKPSDAQTWPAAAATFAAFFAGRVRYPRFKSRHGRQSAHYTRGAFRIRDGRAELLERALSLPEPPSASPPPP